MGGPIKKDKLFFFVDYQGSRDDTPTSIQTTTVFTAAERQGNFSQLLALGRARSSSTIRSRSTRRESRAIRRKHHSLLAIQPGGAEDPDLVSIIPQPINGNLLNNYQYAQNTYINGDQGDVKVDYNISDKDRFYRALFREQLQQPRRSTPCL